MNSDIAPTRPRRVRSPFKSRRKAIKKQESGCRAEGRKQSFVPVGAALAITLSWLIRPQTAHAAVSPQSARSFFVSIPAIPDPNISSKAS